MDAETAQDKEQIHPKVSKSKQKKRGKSHDPIGHRRSMGLARHAGIKAVPKVVENDAGGSCPAQRIKRLETHIGYINEGTQVCI
jgi:hypothetical protein